MSDITITPELKYELFKRSMESEFRGGNFTIVWKCPGDHEFNSASRHPDKDELIDFARRAMAERIGAASIAHGFKIVDVIDRKVVYDSTVST